LPGPRTTNSRDSSCRVRSSASRASAADARSEARPINSEIRTEIPRFTNKTTTYSGLPITKVSYGGRKKKLKTMKASTDAKMPGQMPPIPAAATTTSRKPNAFVSGSTSSRNGRNPATSATVPTTDTR
jgi:hypothetical protein